MHMYPLFQMFHSLTSRKLATDFVSVVFATRPHRMLRVSPRITDFLERFVFAAISDGRHSNLVVRMFALHH